MEDRLAQHGHISYLEIPATDVNQSAAFYETVFGWKVERRDAGRASFDDGTGTVIGSFVISRSVSATGGILPYIYVGDIDAAAGRVVAAGGQVVKSIHPEGDLWIFTFHDPAGNLLGTWQAGPRARQG